MKRTKKKATRVKPKAPPNLNTLEPLVLEMKEKLKHLDSEVDRIDYECAKVPQTILKDEILRQQNQFERFQREVRADILHLRTEIDRLASLVLQSRRPEAPPTASGSR